MSCSKCIEILFPACANELRVQTGLTPNRDYTAYVLDKFNTLYKAPAFSDNNGVLFVDLSGFPEGYFNAFAGKFNLRLEDVETTGCFAEITLTDCDNVATVSNCLTIVPVKQAFTDNSFLEQEQEEGYILQESGGRIRIQSQYNNG